MPTFFLDAYEIYQDCEIDWIDSLPAHWEVKPVFSLFNANAEKNIGGIEENVLSLSYGSIVRRDVETNFGLLPDSFNTYQILKDGDIVLRLTDLQNDKKSLRVGLAKEKGIITSAYLALRSRPEVCARFAYRLLHAYDTTKVFYGMGGGLRQSMKFEDFRRLPVVLPPLQEQQKIAQFLDHETAKIDTLIDKQQQLIALLKEKRQAVISHAVTKGLDPGAPMRDSGVEWLGEVPVGWVVCQIRRVVDFFEQGKSPECENRPAEVGEWGVLKTSCVNGAVFNFQANKALPATQIPEKRYEVRVGDILMSRASGSKDLIGTVALVENTQEQILLSDKVFRIGLFSSKVMDKYFYYFMQSTYIRKSIESTISGGEGMANNITKASIFSYRISLPSLEQQKHIVEELSTEEKRIGKLVDKSKAAMRLLKEKKSALISAAVTGKIDVRDWQPPTPQ